MKRVSFGDDVAFVPRGDLLDGVRIAPLTQPFEAGALVQAAIFRLRRAVGSSRIPRRTPQIISVLEGSGQVSGTSGVDAPIGAGEAVYLHEGEDHEIKSEAGLTALILEGESLDRFRGRPSAA